MPGILIEDGGKCLPSGVGMRGLTLRVRVAIHPHIFHVRCSVSPKECRIRSYAP